MELAAYVGLDWADRTHAVCLESADGSVVEELELEQKPEVIHAWVGQLREQFGGRPVGIALEQAKGALIHALMMYEFIVLYPINPKALARYRDALAVSGAKDDPSDARLLKDFFRKHQACLQPWTPEDAQTRTIDILAQHRRGRGSRAAGASDHGAAESLFSSGPGLGRCARHHPGLRFSDAVVHTGRCAEGPIRDVAEVLSQPPVPQPATD